MFKKWLIVWCFSLWFVQAQSPFDPDDLNAFYDEFVCEEKDITASVELTPSCEGPQPPHPPRPPIPPAPPLPPVPPPLPPSPPPPGPPPPLEGYVPIVLVNNTGLPDSEVFFVAFGTQVAHDCPSGQICPCGDVNQTYISYGAQPGPFTSIGMLNVTPPLPSTSYSYSFADVPKTDGQTVIYVPAAIKGGQILFSVFNPLKNLTQVSGVIASPNPSLITDLNYSNIYQLFEFTFLPKYCSNPNIPKAPLNRVSVDVSAVDYFSLPMQYTLYPANITAGIFQTRHNTIQSLLDSFSTAGATLSGITSENVWNGLVIPSPDAPQIVRILSPGESIEGPGAVVPPNQFDFNYFDNIAYGYNWASNVWYGPDAYYRQNLLTLVTSVLDNFTGKVIDTNSFVFTSTVTGKTYTIPWIKTLDALDQSTTAAIFHPPSTFPGMTFTPRGGQPVPVTNLTDVDLTNAIDITKMLASAIVAGILPGRTNKLTISGPSNALITMYYTPNQLLPKNGYLYGPWYDLYSLGLIGTGNMTTGNIVYAYAYDDYLYTQSPALANVAPSVLDITPQTYIVIQLNEYSDR